MSTVVLDLGGQTFDGWTSVVIGRGLERAASDFAFSLTTRPERGAQLRIRPQEPCEIRIDDLLVISGFCDAVSISFDGSSRITGVSGRSRTEDLIDCTVANKSRVWRNRTVDQIALDMLQPYDVGLIVEVSTGAPIPKFVAQRGETVFAALDRAAKLRGLLITDSVGGALVLTRASETLSAVPLIVGGDDGNVLSGEGSFDGSDLFSTYRCKGQQAGSDTVSAEAAAHPSATVTDGDFIDRFRLLEVDPPSRATTARCRDLARFESAVRAGKAIDITYTVHGWRQRVRRAGGSVEVGDLWTPNVLVPVIDPIMGINADLLLAEVLYELSNETGETTQLRLAPREAYELLSEPVRAKRRKRGDKPTKGVEIWEQLAERPVGPLRETGRF